MDPEIELISLIDLAIATCQLAQKEAGETHKAWLMSDAALAESQFQKIRDQTLSKTLPSSKGGGLGITRSLSEWAPPYLYKAGEDVEKYYMNHF